MLFYTNTSRRSESVLVEQKMSIPMNRNVLREMRSMAYAGRAMLEAGNFDDFGRLLDESWKLKKSLASKISSREIDDIYARARKTGALGGKITGAGGGGFLLLYCPRERQYALREELSSLVELPFHLENDGTKVIFNYQNPY